MAGSCCRAAAVLAILCAFSAGANASPCSIAEYLKQLRTVSDLQTSATLLSAMLPIVGGSPDNSTVFLPSDSAWAAFRKTYGASAPDLNRTVAIFLYNSVIGYGEITTATLATVSPVETSAYVLQLAFAPSDVNITLSFTAATNSTAATSTSMNGVTANVGQRYDFCNTYSYTVDKVLLPAATYAATTTTSIAQIAAITSRQNNDSSPPLSTGAGAAATPAAAPPPAPTPAAAPPPPKSGAATALTSSLTLACGLAAAVMLTLA